MTQPFFANLERKLGPHYEIRIYHSRSTDEFHADLVEMESSHNDDKGISASGRGETVLQALLDLGDKL